MLSRWHSVTLIIEQLLRCIQRWVVGGEKRDRMVKAILSLRYL